MELNTMKCREIKVYMFFSILNLYQNLIFPPGNVAFRNQGFSASLFKELVLLCPVTLLCGIELAYASPFLSNEKAWDVWARATPFSLSSVRISIFGSKEASVILEMTSAVSCWKSYLYRVEKTWLLVMHSALLSQQILWMIFGALWPWTPLY